VSSGGEVLQNYKLRLSDGTVLAVDHGGLSTWLVDDGAMVQPADSHQWRPLREFLAEEKAAVREAARQKARVSEPVPAVRSGPHEDEPGARSVRSTLDLPPDAEVRGPSALLVLADDVSASPTRPSATPARAGDALPIIPLKPLEEDRAGTERGNDEGGQGDVYEEAPPGDVLYERMLRILVAMGNVLSPLTHRLDRMVRGWRSPALTAPVPRHSPTSSGIPLEPPRLVPQSSRSRGPRPSRREKARTLRDTAVAWLAGLKAWLDRIARRSRRAPPSPIAPAWQAASSAEEPVSREPLKAPPPISQVPILRLAPLEEPEDEETVFTQTGPSGAGWIWVRRIVVVVCLATGGVLAVLNRESWVPEAARLSRVLFGKIDQRTRSRQQLERRTRALQESTDQLPHLSPETIERVLSASPDAALDPRQVFRLACDAADRGLFALTPGEVQELTALRQRVLDGLSPAERERTREYDRARAIRVTLPFEDREVLALIARGARALPPATRQRLQTLSGKAIASGLPSGGG
jgi:hypothetical protein